MLLAVVAGAGCHRTDRADPPKREPPVVAPAVSDAAPVHAAVVLDAGPDASATFVGAGGPTGAPRFEVLAIRVLSDRHGPAAFELHDVGSRVILTSGKPIAWADGPGALVREPRLAVGLAIREPDAYRPADSGWIESIAGTYPDAMYAVYGIMPEARAVKFDLSLHRWTGDGWRRDEAVAANDMPVALVPFEDRGVVVAGYTKLPNRGYPSEWDGLKRSYVKVTSEGRKDLGLVTAIEGIIKATRDGHTWVLGRRKGLAGIHLVHRTGGQTTDHVVPGTQGCVAESALWTSRGEFDPLQVAPGGRALVYIDERACTGVTPGIFEETATGLARSPLSDVARSNDYDPQLAAVGADHAVWIGSSSSHVLWRAPSEGAPERRDLPRLVRTGSELRADYTPYQPDRRRLEPGECALRSVLAVGLDDVWVVAECFTKPVRYDVVLRWGKPQSQLVSL
jgi:hypothetical protein